MNHYMMICEQSELLQNVQLQRTGRNTTL